METTYIVFWLAATIVFILVELITVGLTSIWFAAGALGAFVVAALGGGVVVQAVVFIIISVVLLILTKPWARKYVNSKTQKTNVAGLVGRQAILTEDVDNLRQTGKTALDGIDWMVRSYDDSQTIKNGELVEVTGISGVKLIVKKVEKEN